MDRRYGETFRGSQNTATSKTCMISAFQKYPNSKCDYLITIKSYSNKNSSYDDSMSCWPLRLKKITSKTYTTTSKRLVCSRKRFRRCRAKSERMSQISMSNYSSSSSLWKKLKKSCTSRSWGRSGLQLSTWRCRFMMKTTRTRWWPICRTWTWNRALLSIRSASCSTESSTGTSIRSRFVPKQARKTMRCHYIALPLFTSNWLRLSSWLSRFQKYTSATRVANT